MEKEKLIKTVKLAQKGDSDALNELFNAFYNDVYYFALKNVKDEDWPATSPRKPLWRLSTHWATSRSLRRL